jgi:ribonuclease BN (tRNA processing enzyme)
LARDGRINYPRISHVFITHLHADHIGGLEELALMNAFIFGEAGAAPGQKPLLVSSSEILAGLWEHSLRGGLEVIRGKYAKLEDYFMPLALTPNDARSGFMLVGRYRFTAFPTDHLRLPDNTRWPSLGLWVRDVQSGETAFYSGDTRFDPATYGAALETARIAFHEAYLGEGDPGVHTRLAELRTLKADVKRKTWLYHYGDDWDSTSHGPALQEFAGLARPFQRYVLFE